MVVYCLSVVYLARAADPLGIALQCLLASLRDLVVLFGDSLSNECVNLHDVRTHGDR